MEINILSCLKDNYAYVLRSENQTAVVDTPDATVIYDFLNSRGLKLDFILSTHHHWDHTQGNIELKYKYNCDVLGYKAPEQKIPEITTPLEHNQKTLFGSTYFNALYIPGHTLDQLAYWFPEEKVVFTGDTLFSMGCGRLFEGTYEQMWESLQTLKELPADTLVYCGHEYTIRNAEFTMQFYKTPAVESRYQDALYLRAQNRPTVPVPLAVELETNLFLRAKNIAEFKKLREARNSW